ncbi:monovalent cation:proton antiporter family protein [Azoarcus olearius]|uniref:Glutathione-regulated potassium-efflux system protein n=1 Tax=Azoarcus sp. (strain BH72) TaxID=418699 RepID=A1K3K7_AZOSB|nr:monovalent cation:proton antiporter family protein [Azoarcus olearius]ANQ83933.1 putative glutathione-regulated potassium-efflux system protein [Azoarcus olearius]CAL93412.1 putative glutathione-regulated potassium-efflux system protein [Azoarcus olearius]
MLNTLDLVLLLLAAAVVLVAVLRSVNLPPVLGYLLVGAMVGPHAFNLVPDSAGARHLAEFGVVFLMFSIGLEFSLPRLLAMKNIVFGLGAAQVVGSIALTLVLGRLGGLGWAAAFALGGTIAMSSTAILSKLLADRLELDSRHGREIIGVLLFQDLAVVPLLILLPALSRPAEELAVTLGLAGIKAVVLLALVLVFGPRLMRWWFTLVARRRSGELFMLNVLFITLGLAWLSELVGLSLALGAFLAGMLISETEYRYQVEEDIKPFRDVLLGLFFVTVGMFLDVETIVWHLPAVIGLVVALLAAKFLIVFAASRAFRSPPGTAMRSGLWLCAGGEFGFVLLSEIVGLRLMPAGLVQVTVAALVLSMLVAPLIVQVSDKLVMRFVASEWLLRSMELTRVAAQSLNTDKHIIVCGYGRSGQYMARFLEQENLSYVALDLDPERVREAGAAGDTVVYGDAARRETLMAAGIMRASALVISFAEVEAALRVMHHAHALRPGLPIVVRAVDEADMEKLSLGGAAEVVPEAFEGSIMLASHALALIGVPLSRVVKRIRDIRNQRYALMRGFFHGATDIGEVAENSQARLHSVTVPDAAPAVGRTIGELALEEFGVGVSAVRRRGIRGLSPGPETRIVAGDVLVLLGLPQGLEQAEERVLKG